jgi:flagellin-like hook-associated protein FlgL
MEITGLQFGLAVAVAPVGTLVAALLVYMVNSRSGKERALELKNDVAAQLSQLKADVGANVSRLESRIDGINGTIRDSQTDLKEWIRAEMRASAAEMTNQILRLQQAPPRSRSASVGQNVESE